MPDYGVTDTGFNRKRLDELLAQFQSAFKTAFGDNLNVDADSPAGELIGVLAESYANLWEATEGAYNAFNPNAATHDSLSNLVQLNYIERLPAVPTVVELTLTGDEGALIEVGSLVSSSSTADVFATDASVTIGVGGTITVSASCLVTGVVPAPAGTVDTIDTPINGWVSVTNVADGAQGRDEETDAELRARRKRSVAINSQTPMASIVAAVADVDGVTNVIGRENDTGLVNDAGLPPNSINILAEGGADLDIGTAIYAKKAGGITTYGNTTTVITGADNAPKVINFSRPVTIDIYITVTITTFDNYPTGGDTQIKQAIVDYAAGNLVAGREFTVGDDVILTRLYTPINSVAGHEIDDLIIGVTQGDQSAANITIESSEVSAFDVDNIEVVYSA